MSWESLGVCDIVFPSSATALGAVHGLWVMVLSGEFLLRLFCSVAHGSAVRPADGHPLVWGMWSRCWVDCSIHWGLVECWLRLDNRWWCCGRFQFDPVRSDRDAMRGMNSVGTSIVILYHFPIDPEFAAITEGGGRGWFDICLTATFDCVMLYTRRPVVVWFAIKAFFLRMSSFATPKLIMAGAKRWSVIGSVALVRRRSILFVSVYVCPWGGVFL